MRTSDVWLIELKNTITGKPSWYGWEDDEEGLGIVEDPYKAIRFSRKWDAERVIWDIGWTEATAVEHGFDESS